MDNRNNKPTMGMFKVMMVTFDANQRPSTFFGEPDQFLAGIAFWNGSVS
jgi:hypothetical protein